MCAKAERTVAVSVASIDMGRGQSWRKAICELHSYSHALQIEVVEGSTVPVKDYDGSHLRDRNNGLDDPYHKVEVLGEVGLND